MEDQLIENELSIMATTAINDITSALLHHFSSEDDKSYRRAMFRQNGEYGCSLVISVILEDGNKKASIISKFGCTS